MNKRHVAKWTKTLPPLLWRFINDNCWYLIGCKLQDLENDPDLNQRHLPDHLTSTMEVVSSDEEESPSYPYHKQLSQQVRHTFSSFASLVLHAVWYIRVGRKSFWVQFLFSVTLSQALMLCSNSDAIH